MKYPLSVQLREGTRKVHREVENTPFVRSFFEGRLSKEVYREFLVQLFHIYTAMEDHHERHSQHEVFGKLYFPELLRKEALLQDLKYYHGNNTWEDKKPMKSTQTYVQRISDLSENWVEGLVAHHYTRYLGDLSGGQQLALVIAKSFKLPSSEGIAFYNFPDIPDYSKFKKDYRALLDVLLVDESSSGKIVDEANRAFELNKGIFEAMEEVAMKE